MNWQPISSAPRDLTSVLVYVPGTAEDFEEYTVAFFKNGGWRKQEDKIYVEPTHWAELTRP